MHGACCLNLGIVPRLTVRFKEYVLPRMMEVAKVSKLSQEAEARRLCVRLYIETTVVIVAFGLLV